MVEIVPGQDVFGLGLRGLHEDRVSDQDRSALAGVIRGETDDA